MDSLIFRPFHIIPPFCWVIFYSCNNVRCMLLSLRIFIWSFYELRGILPPHWFT